MKRLLLTVLMVFLFTGVVSAYDLCIPIGDTNLAQTRDTLAIGGNYEEEIESPPGSGIMVPNPQSKINFIKARVREFLIGDYKRGKLLIEGQAAIDAIKAAAAIEAADELEPTP